MPKKPSQDMTISRRSLIALGAGTFGLTLLGGRMFQLQMLEAQKYTELAAQNRIDWKILLPKRGKILDRTGMVIADSAWEYDFYLLESLSDLNEADLGRMLSVLTQDTAEQESLQDQVLSSAKRPLLLRRDITYEQLVRLEFNRARVPDYTVRQQLRRHYIFGKDFAPVIGYVGKPSAQDRQGQSYELLDEFRLGKAGIEQQYEPLLRGHLGKAAIKVNVVGKQLGELQRNESTAGADLRLHVHGKLQQATMNLLRQHRSACAVVMDAFTGGVVSLASHPFYDANEMKGNLDAARWRELRNDPLKLLVNKALSGLYAPGSTLKPVVALAAMRAGISPQKTHFCPGYISLGRSRFHCWKKHGHGSVDMIGAIQQSCDVWFYQVARQIGIDAIADMARELGMGAISGIDLENEKRGLIPDTAWKRRALDQPFYPGEVVIHGIGQGFTQTTPLQIALSYATFINGGKLIRPYLLDSVQSERPDLLPAVSRSEPQSLPIPEDHRLLVQKALINAVNQPRGTAYRSRLTEKDDGFQMAGKTGTTQVRRITLAERAEGIRKDNIEWRLRDHALFAGFAPVHNPRYVAVSLVEHGVSGARSAAPIVRDIFRAMGQFGMIEKVSS